VIFGEKASDFCTTSEPRPGLNPIAGRKPITIDALVLPPAMYDITGVLIVVFSSAGTQPNRNRLRPSGIGTGTVHLLSAALHDPYLGHHIGAEILELRKAPAVRLGRRPDFPGLWRMPGRVGRAQAVGTRPTRGGRRWGSVRRGFEQCGGALIVSWQRPVEGLGSRKRHGDFLHRDWVAVVVEGISRRAVDAHERKGA